ncbi:MAG: serine/threonine-protein kinase [bacterium]|nr:serine/threonine-protein kinase [bacterium]
MSPTQQKRQFGPYVVHGGIGIGGVAKVFRATDERDGRVVALKLLQASFAEDSDMGRRFKKEAEIVKALNHPCIVPVYDYGVLRGRPYVAMKYMAGGSLAARFDEPAEITAQEVVRLLRRIASALDHAQRHGVIHRDIKLENILLDERGEASLSDFGLAKMDGLAQHTGSGDIIGTPIYMSPEQARGVKTLDHRSDLYSLAVVTYILTVGRLPFTGNVMAVLNQHAHATPPLPSVVSPGLPPALDAVLLKGMAKAPQERYPTADSFIEAYARAMADHAGRRVTIDLNASYSDNTVPTVVENIPAFFESPKPGITADNLFRQAQGTDDTTVALALLKQALDLDPWHVEANRLRLKLEKARAAATPPPTPKPLTTPLPEMKRSTRDQEKQRQRRLQQRRRRIATLAGFMLLSASCSALTSGLLGLFPGVIATVTQIFGGRPPVTEINGVPIENLPDAAALVPPSKSVEAPQQGADVLDHGLLHEYLFEAVQGEEYYIYIQFMSLAASSVAKNVVVITPSGNPARTEQCYSMGEGGLLGGEANTTITCMIDQTGTWRVRVLGIEGESIGAYFVGVTSGS